jgi:catechol 2,3-dioxygenase-like lactoylglutathione lyase family enzyme
MSSLPLARVDCFANRVGLRYTMPRAAEVNAARANDGIRGRLAMIKARRFGHATFDVTDLEREIAYYQDVIGLQAVERDRDRAFLCTEVGQLAVALERGAESRCTKLSFEVSPDLDLRDAARRLAERDIRSEIVGDAAPGLREMLTFKDPKGTSIQLFSRWEFLAANGAANGARPNKLGHLAFVTPDPKAMAQFYIETLGFSLADWIEDWFVFLRCCPDHHTVNFVQGPANRIHHLAFELRDSSHMHLSCDILGRNKIPIAWGPVRHGPGHNIAAYHRNAGGHLVEFFIDMDEMLDEQLGYYEPRPWHRDRPQRPKVWTGLPRDIWGQPPTQEFIRARE